MDERPPTGSDYWVTSTQPAPAPAPPDRTPPPSGPAWAAAGWGAAVVRALVAIVTLGVLAQLVVLIPYAGSGEDRPSLPLVARLGGLLFYGFHHVGTVISVPRSAFGAEPGFAGFPFDLSAGVAIASAPLLGTLLGLLLLARGGRAVGNEAGGSAVARGLHGLKIAVPYAAVCFGASFALKISGSDFDPSAPPGIDVHPSHVAALLWPLLLAGVAGFVGGFRSGGEDAWTVGAWPTRARAALAGGASMLALGLALSFVGLLVMAVVYPDATREYFEPFNQGLAPGFTTVVFTLLFLPNITAWVLFPAMGACDGVFGTFSFCFLSYTQYPGSGGQLTDPSNPFGGLNLPNPPAGLYLFILAPLGAVLLGGMIAARRGRAATRNEAAGLGALAGVAFALLAVAMILLAEITARFGGRAAGFAIAGRFRAGPDLVLGPLLALAWGVIGGGLGGLLQGRSLPLWRRARAVTEPTGPPDLPRPPETEPG